MYTLREIATVVIVTLSVALLTWGPTLKPLWRRALFGVVGLFAAFKAFELVKLGVGQVRTPPLWDFKAFWMFGQVAAAHHNVYDPASYRMFGALLNPTNDPEFNAIALNIGLPYPPPAVLLVYPLSFFPTFTSAMIAWYAAIGIAVVAGIYVLWRNFFAGQGTPGLLCATVLMVSLAATQMNVGLGQITFFILLLLLMFFNEKTPWRAGMWLAPLIVLRPLFILLAIYFAVRRQWSALLSLTATSLALIVLSVPLLGPGGLSTYLFHNPTGRYPETYFYGTQCLYKLMVTLHPRHDLHFSLATHPLYDILALAFIAAAAVVCARRAKLQRDACLSLLVMLGLWVYPSTATHYTVLMLVPLCVLWRERERLGLAPNVVAAIFFAAFLLLDFHDGQNTTGLAIVLGGLLFAFLAFRRAVPNVSAFARRARPEPVPAVRL